MRVRPLIALHADGLDRQEHRERLPDLIVQPRVFDRVDVNLIHRADRLERPLRADVAEDAHRESRAWERVPRDERLRDVHDQTELPHFVLEEHPQRLHELESELFREPADVVVRFDRVRVLLVASRRRARLDDVRVQGPLHEKRRPDARLVLHRLLVLLKHLDERRADRLALLLRVRHALELPQKPFAVVDARHRKMQVLSEGRSIQKIFIGQLKGDAIKC